MLYSKKDTPTLYGGLANRNRYVNGPKSENNLKQEKPPEKCEVFPLTRGPLANQVWDRRDAVRMFEHGTARVNPGKDRMENSGLNTWISQRPDN